MAMMRLDKLVAEAAGVSRADAKKLITKGQVQVDKATIRTIDAKVNSEAPLMVAGRSLGHSAFVYIMLDKPKGVVSASKDARDATVVTLVEKEFPRRQLFPAGRLDKASTGFVLLTDDGAFAHDILSPRRHVSKTYEVELDVPATPEMVAAFEAGATLADGEKMKPAGLVVHEDAFKVTVELRQGVYHQIKRMFGVYDAGVNELRRTAIGPVTLDDRLGEGGFRQLTDEEVQSLRNAVFTAD